MRKLVIGLLFCGFVMSAVPAQANPIEKGAKFVVDSGKNIIGLTFDGAHTVLHTTKDIIVGTLDISIGFTHEVLKWLQIPFKNGE